MTLKHAQKVLTKRMIWLETRIKASDKDLTYDKEELEALQRAVDLMQEAINYGDE